MEFLASYGIWVLFFIMLSVICACKVAGRMKKVEENDTKREVIPVIPRGSWGWPVIGETLEFIACGYSSTPVNFMNKRKSLYGNVFRTNLLGKAIIVSTDPEVSRIILQNHGDVFTPCYPKSITELLGKSSILQMNGALHKKMHTLISVFLKSPQFKAQITKEIENVVRLSLSTWSEQGNRVYIQDETKKITFKILVKVLLGIDPGQELKLLKQEFEEVVKGLICLPIKLPGTRQYKSLKAKRRLIQMVRKIIERKTSMETTDDKSPSSVVDLLLREKSEDDKFDIIIDNIIEMMIPGEETVPTAMTLAVKFLLDNPASLSHLVEENMQLKEKKGDDEYSWSDYLSLPFTQNVISETLRLGNIINAVWRKALKDVTIKGYLIPKGWCVMTSFSSIHMDATHYENPYEFDPWRWKDAGAGAGSHIFTPFGGGQRLCPGLELTRLETSIFLHHLVTSYRMSAQEKDQIIYFPTVRMKMKLPVSIKPVNGK